MKIANNFEVGLDEFVGFKPLPNKANKKGVHKNKRSVKVQELFDKLPVSQQRAILSMI